MTEAPAPPPPPIVPAPALSRFQLAILVPMLGFGAFLTVGLFTQLLSIGFGLWWCELVIFLGIPFMALRLSGRAPFKAMGLRQPWVAGALFGFVLGLANFFAVVAPTQYLSQLVTPKWLLEYYDAAQIFRDKGPLELAMIIGGVCLAAPFCEEIFFRGVLQPGLNEKISAPLAIITTGWVFSFFHLDPVGFMARWELGILFGLLAWRTGSLWPGMFAHLANNLVSTVLYFSLKDQADDGTNDPMAVAAIAGIGGLVLLGVMLIARRFPQVLTAPSRPEEERIVARPADTLLPWGIGATVALGALLVFDWRGSWVRAIDAVIPVKHPNAALHDAREQALHGEMSFGDYRRARAATKDGGS